MSAFVVSDKHISVIVNFGLGYDWVSNMVEQYVKSQPAEKHAALFEQGETQILGDILKAQNVRSVQARYGEEAHTATPFDWCYNGSCFIIQVIKACDCLEYQSSETKDYKEPDAYKILDAIRREAIRALPGYSEADWDIE